MSKPKVVILGGGVCGLYAARKLAAAGAAVTVVEKEDVFGGLAVSRKHGRNYFDLGVHMLHEYNREIFEDCRDIMGDERVEVQLDARIRWAGGYYRYPLQFGDMVKGMPVMMLAKCVAGLFAAQLRNKIAPWEPKDCEEALIQLYGKPLYEFFFKEFTTRYWGMPPTEMSAMFVRRKMPRLTAVDAIKKMLESLGLKEKPGRSVGSALLEETLHYSRTGAETLPRRLASQVRKDGGKLLAGHSVEELRAVKGKVERVVCKKGANGDTIELACDYCINTIPVTALLPKLKPPVPRPVIDSSNELRYLPIVIYGLLVKKKRVLDALYVYYRERIFHRVGEPKNAGLKVTPEDHTVLIVEMTCQVGDEKWNGDESVRQEVFRDLEAEGVCAEEDVVELHVLRNGHGYPVFALGYEPHHEAVEAQLATYENLQSTGRQGGFCFPGMHTAMRMGADAARHVIAEAGLDGKEPPP